MKRTMNVKNILLSFFATLILSLFLISCSDGGGGSSSGTGSVTVNDSMDATWDGVGFDEFVYDNSSDSVTNVSYTLNNLANNRVLITLTNTNSGNQSLNNGSGAGVYSFDPFMAFDIAGRDTSNHIPEHITSFNNQSHKFTSDSQSFSADILPAPLVFDIVGTTTRAWKTSSDADASYDPVNTTLRAQENLTGGKVLKIWVADDMWDAVGGVDLKIDQAKIDLVVSKFATVTDIYAKVQTLAGLEWGAQPYVDLIDPATSEIHIVYADLGDPGSWGLLGYFWAVNNFKTTSYAYSNEALVFFMDAPTYGEDTDNDGTWEGTQDLGPVKLLGTLAHEFQHMIHFYQKDVLRNVSSETWFNEMISMSVEDILSEDIGGIGTGPSQGDGSRLSNYVKTPICNITVWSSSSSGDCNVYDSYATSFSLGGYLMRHYGGTSIMTNFVQSTATSLEDGLTYVLAQEGAGIDWKEALRRWGASLAMDTGQGSLNPEYGYPELVDGTYTLQAADMYGFGASYTPRIYTTLPGELKGYSNVVWDKGVQTGSYTSTVSIPPGVIATIVVEP